jgi:site-specific recombinase XerD
MWLLSGKGLDRLRHVSATQFLRGGGNVLALRRLLGHVSDALFTRYAEIVEAGLQAAHGEASPAERYTQKLWIGR